MAQVGKEVESRSESASNIARRTPNVKSAGVFSARRQKKARTKAVVRAHFSHAQLRNTPENPLCFYHGRPFLNYYAARHAARRNMQIQKRLIPDAASGFIMTDLLDNYHYSGKKSVFIWKYG